MGVPPMSGDELDSTTQVRGGSASLGMGGTPMLRKKRQTVRAHPKNCTSPTFPYAPFGER